MQAEAQDTTGTITFGKLEDVEVRRAWSLEARGFTPWLAANLDRLGEALGLKLELVDRPEVRVGRFSADILARDVRDDSPVLIENQLEWSDHTHLGQLLTYLTGLKAEKIVWIAPNFRPEHLSAIRWLNENTKNNFAFFAVQLRVVRIGESPLAPLFEVLERPNDWDRYLKEAASHAQEQPETSAASIRRRGFWTQYAKSFPEAVGDVAGGGNSSRWRSIPGTELFVSQWFATDGVGVFVRGRRGVSNRAVYEQLLPFSLVLEQRLGAPLENGDFLLLQRLDANTADEARWAALSVWLHDHAQLYTAVLSEILGAG